MLPEQGISRFR